MENSSGPPSSYDSENRITSRRIVIVTPAPSGSTRGNRITAERWAAILVRLGYVVEVVEEYRDEAADVLIVLHAGRSAESVRRFRDHFPDRPLLVAVTGTDIYSTQFDPAVIRESLAAGDRIIVLQPRTADDLPNEFKAKVRVIYQSALPPVRREAPKLDRFEIAVVGHLRPVKDPFRAAAAAKLLEPSKIQIVHLGAALSQEMIDQARHEESTNPRYRWLGDLPHEEALAIMARCRLVAMTSLSEGGPAVIAEAIVAGVPVIATRVSGCIGMLGEDYPGLFPPGNTQALADLFRRVALEPLFFESLRAACDRRRSLFSPATEATTWRAILAECQAGRLALRA